VGLKANVYDSRNASSEKTSRKGREGEREREREFEIEIEIRENDSCILCHTPTYSIYANGIG